MDDGEDVEAILFYRENDLVGEAGHECSAKLPEDHRIMSRIFLDATDRVLDGVQEFGSEALPLAFVPEHRFP